MEKISQKNKIRSIFMLPNRLIITEKSKRKAIYENSKDKWIIDFEDKIKSWSDFYDIIQKEMDFLGYNEKYRKDNYTYHDIVGDLIVFKKMKERKKKEQYLFLITQKILEKLKIVIEKTMIRVQYIMIQYTVYQQNGIEIIELCLKNGMPQQILKYIF